MLEHPHAVDANVVVVISAQQPPGFLNPRVITVAGIISRHFPVAVSPSTSMIGFSARWAAKTISPETRSKWALIAARPTCWPNDSPSQIASSVKRAAMPDGL
jgi:hypothetical protein